MFCRKISLLFVLVAMVLSASAEEYLHSSREGKYSASELQSIKTAADNGDMEKAVIYGSELILSGKNEREGIKYLELAADHNNPTAIYYILIMTTYKTEFYYEKLKKLAKVNEEANELLWWYEEY